MARFGTCTLLVALLVSLAGPAPAADPRGLFSVKGVGTADCQRYLNARKEGGREYFVFAGYLGGYLTAHNQLSEATFDIVPWQTIDTIAGMMSSFCAKNPTANFAVAVTRLVKFLEPERLAVGSETVEAKVGTSGVTIYRETLRRAQMKLAEAGHYRGTPDGQFTPVTRAALEKFQSAKGLPKTGLPDQVTLLRLLLTQEVPR